MPPADDSSDDEESRAHSARMRAAVEMSSFSVSKADTAAAAAAKAAQVIAQATAATAASAAAAAASALTSDGTAPASPNPFASLLAPPPSPLLLLPCSVVSGPLLSNPYRVSFRSAVNRSANERRAALDRRRRASSSSGAHESKRLVSADSTDDLVHTYAPRVLNPFETKLSRNLENMLARDVQVEENVWKEMKEIQKQKQQRCMKEAEKYFKLIARTGAHTEAAESAEAVVKPAVAMEEDAAAAAAAKAARKQARKEQKARDAAAASAATSESASAPPAVLASLSSLPAASSSSEDTAAAAAATVDESEVDRTARKKEAKRLRKEAAKRKLEQTEGEEGGGGGGTQQHTDGDEGGQTNKMEDVATTSNGAVATGEGDAPKSQKKQKKQKKVHAAADP